MHVGTYITDQIRSSEYVNAKKKLLSVESMFEDDNFIVKAALGLILNQ